jgi:hypothetical protein
LKPKLSDSQKLNNSITDEIQNLENPQAIDTSDKIAALKKNPDHRKVLIPFSGKLAREADGKIEFNLAAAQSQLSSSTSAARATCSQGYSFFEYELREDLHDVHPQKERMATL